MRGRLFRRFAILLALMFVLGTGVVTVLLTATAIAFRLVDVPASPWAIWITAGVSAVVLVSGLLMAGRRLGRHAAPVADVVEAAGQLAEGNYAARVIERGSPDARRLAGAFNRMATRLEAQETERRHLLAEIAHELRTPVAVIQGNLEGLLDGVYARDEAHLSAVLEETRVLSTLIDDLRTLALAESGTLALHRESVDLGALLQDVVVAFGARVEDAGLTVTVECPADLPALEVGPVRIRQVVANLLTNAIQHTAAGGGIRVGCQWRAEAGEVSVSIADSGAGIAPEDLPHIFTRFYKSKDSRGSGLGLAIAQQLVLLHGGRIVAESQLGQGATVRFSIPVDRA
jgi:two-component system OmpR family sensor kinase/two-component system sensor histidine kinase BaeS